MDKKDRKESINEMRSRRASASSIFASMRRKSTTTALTNSSAKPPPSTSESVTKRKSTNKLKQEEYIFNWVGWKVTKIYVVMVSKNLNTFHK